eukprot:2793155-Pleurochrysis_carterae.AAC.1
MTTTPPSNAPFSWQLVQIASYVSVLSASRVPCRALPRLLPALCAAIVIEAELARVFLRPTRLFA